MACYRAGRTTPNKIDYPSDRMVAEIVHSAKCMDEQWILDELAYLHDNRGLRWGTQHGPRSFKWFITALSDRADLATAREDAQNDRWDHDGTRKTT